MTERHLTPTALREIRERWGLSQADMGARLGVGGRTRHGRGTTIYRYETGRVPIPDTVAILVHELDTQEAK